MKFCAGDFSLDDAPQLGRPVEADSVQIESNWERPMLYHKGDSQHIQNIQINKVIGENEKYAFYFMEKNKWTFWPTHHIEKFYLLMILWYENFFVLMHSSSWHTPTETLAISLMLMRQVLESP